MLNRLRALVQRKQWVTPQLARVFKGWTEGSEPLAELLLAYVGRGERAAEVAALTEAQAQAFYRQVSSYAYGEAFKPIAKDHRLATSEQWIRMGRILALTESYGFPRPNSDQTPNWLLAIQMVRSYIHSDPEVWEPGFIEALLEADGIPPEDRPRAALAAFWESHGPQREVGVWRDRGHTRAARIWVAYVCDHIGAVPGTLAGSPAAAQVNGLEWLTFYPEVLPPLAPMLATFASARSKRASASAVELIVALPEPLRSQTLVAALAQGKGPNLPNLVNRIARLGEAGRGVLEAALGQDPRRDQVIRPALDRLEVAAPAPDAAAADPGTGGGSGDLLDGIVLPARPESVPGPSAEEVLPVLEAAVAREIAAKQAILEEYPKASWARKAVAAARKLDRPALVSLLDFVNLKTDRWLPGLRSERLPEGFDKVLVRFPVEGVARLCVSKGSDGVRRFDFLRLESLIGRDHDLRVVADAVEWTGVADAAEKTAQRVFDYRGLYGRSPQNVWPFFALNPLWLERGLGIAPSSRPDHRKREDTANTLAILDMFPALPDRFLPAVAELATGEAKTFRRAAQDMLQGHPRALGLAVQALGSSKQAVRAAAAAWLGRLGDVDGIGPLREALAKERREPVQAAVLSALAALGEDISQHLTPAALGAAAAKGLAGKRPASLGWFPMDALPACRWADGTPVEPSTIQWWVVLADKLKDPQGAGLIPVYVSLLDKASREALGRFVLDTWVARDTSLRSDAEAREVAASQAPLLWKQAQDNFKRYPKQPWAAEAAAETQDQIFDRLRALRAAELRGSAIADKGLLALATGAPGHHVLATGQRFIRDFPERRSQVEALVTAAAANPDPAAIQFVLSIARKHKQETVRTKAQALSQEIAERAGWSLDELADRTIQTAGFDDSGLLRLDFGPRQFTGRAARSPKTGAFTVALANQDGKPVKALPKPGVADDAEAAAAARKQLTASKKELTQVASLQASRLFEAMCVEREWEAGAWQELFAGHPIMSQLVSTLVWKAVGPDGARVLFRPTPEGELLDAADDPVVLPAGAAVSLAHLVTVTPEEAAAWRSSLEDYQIEPLFQQFESAAPQFAPDAIEVADHRGWLSDSFAIRGRATKRGYSRAPAEDGGWFNHYHKELPGSGVRVEIGFTGSYLPEDQIAAAVTELTFYSKTGQRMTLADVPPILLAESHSDYVFVAEAGAFHPQWESRAEF
jgi:hypothetical protein